MKRIGIIGFGNIGKKLYEKIIEKGWVVDFIATSSHIFVDDLRTSKNRLDNWFNYCQNIDLVFLAIPTFDDGKTALNYINALTTKGIPVVTCEKGALANYFTELKPRLSHIGFSATVGGGSGIVHFLNHRFFTGTREVHTILNGTLNYIWDDLKMGNPLGHVVEEIRKLGYTEPSNNDPIDIILGEISSDVTKKTSILFNLCFHSKSALMAKDIDCVLAKEAVKRAIKEAGNRRFIVSFEREENFQEEIESVQAFIHRIGGWVITGGFKRMDRNPLIGRLCNSTTWVNNAVLTVEGDSGADGVYICGGPGAGASPTTAAMIRDAERLPNRT